MAEVTGQSLRVHSNYVCRQVVALQELRTVMGGGENDYDDDTLGALNNLWAQLRAVLDILFQRPGACRHKRGREAGQQCCRCVEVGRVCVMMGLAVVGC
jgi:hypothetical protein